MSNDSKENKFISKDNFNIVFFFFICITSKRILFDQIRLPLASTEIIITTIIIAFLIIIIIINRISIISITINKWRKNR